MECQKAKFNENCIKNWAKSIIYASCTSSRQYFLNLLRSYQLEVQDQIKKKSQFILVKIDSKEWKITTWSAEKYNVEQNLLRIGQAVPKAGSIF